MRLWATLHHVAIERFAPMPHAPQKRAAAQVREWIVLVSMGGDISLAILKFIAAHVTHSSALLAEGVHSVMDALTEVILLYGVIAARRPANVRHQFGFGRETFFWSFVASMVILAVGAGSSFHDGFRQILMPNRVDNIGVGYAVLGVSMVVEVATSFYALRATAGDRGLAGLMHFARTTHDTASLTILFGGLAGIAGLLVAGLGITLGRLLGWSGADGMASIGIGAILAMTAIVLAVQAKSMLIGVSASRDELAPIETVVAGVAGVAVVNGSITVHLTPEQLFVALSISFAPDLKTKEIERVVVDIETALKTTHPEVVLLFVKPQAPARFAIVSEKRGF